METRVVLIIQIVDNEPMFASLLLLGLVAVCVLGCLYGVDSRIDERVDRSPRGR
jgi:hypothetical protein